MYQSKASYSKLSIRIINKDFIFYCLSKGRERKKESDFMFGSFVDDNIGAFIFH